MTGASGFLGVRVMEALTRRGHDVRALTRPEGDLRKPGAAAAVLDGVDAVVHLAAQVTGSDEARFAGTVVATENLLDSMTESGVRRLVLASSYSVYDWSRIESELDEDSPLEADVYGRDGYAVAKWWQERVVRRAADRHGLELTVLRPGYIWGSGHALIDGVGQRVGPVQLVFGPAGTLPLTHVENCADCFAAAVESPTAVGATLNVTDGHGTRTWRYARDTAGGGLCVPVPYVIAFALVRLVHAVARALLGPRLRLPSIFMPRRFEARFKPVRTSHARLQQVLGWRPPLTYEEALRRTIP